MKLITASSLAGMALALPQGPQGRFGTADIQTMIDNMGATGQAATALFSQFRELAGFERILASNQAVSVALAFQFGGGYGCWCYFGEDHNLKLAKGIPLDGYDQACHALSRAYECAIIDSGDTCVPWAIDYETVNVAAGNDFLALCEVANAGTDADALCKQRACAIESQFTLNVIEANSGGLTADPLLKHTHADWESKKPDLCKGVKDGPTTRDLSCCGTYPNRYPLNRDAPNKGCCTNPNPIVEVGTYHKVSHQCCAIETASGSGVFDTTIIGNGDVCTGTVV